MPRPSSVSKLPKKIREKITGLREQGRSIDEIIEHLEQLDVEISRSALGRHLKKQKKVAEQIRRSRQLAEAVGRQFGDAETSKVARTNIELLHAMTMKILIGSEDEVEVNLDPKDAMLVATTIEKLSKASKITADQEIKIREEERNLAKQAAAKDAVKAARKEGISAETVKAIKESILGVGA